MTTGFLSDALQIKPESISTIGLVISGSLQLSKLRLVIGWATEKKLTHCWWQKQFETGHISNWDRLEVQIYSKTSLAYDWKDEVRDKMQMSQFNSIYKLQISSTTKFQISSNNFSTLNVNGYRWITQLQKPCPSALTFDWATELRSKCRFGKEGSSGSKEVEWMIVVSHKVSIVSGSGKEWSQWFYYYYEVELVSGVDWKWYCSRNANVIQINSGTAK